MAYLTKSMSVYLILEIFMGLFTRSAIEGTGASVGFWPLDGLQCGEDGGY